MRVKKYLAEQNETSNPQWCHWIHFCWPHAQFYYWICGLPFRVVCFPSKTSLKKIIFICKCLSIRDGYWFRYGYVPIMWTPAGLVHVALVSESSHVQRKCWFRQLCFLDVFYSLWLLYSFYFFFLEVSWTL